MVTSSGGRRLLLRATELNVGMERIAMAWRLSSIRSVLAGLLMASIASAAAPWHRTATSANGEARVVSAEERRTFYRTAAKELLGRTVHLHVEAEVLRKTPHEFTDRSGARWVRFENRGVPLTIPARAACWLQVRRHLDGAKEFCLHGRVRMVPDDERQRAGVEVSRIARAPGSWR